MDRSRQFAAVQSLRIGVVSSAAHPDGHIQARYYCAIVCCCLRFVCTFRLTVCLYRFYGLSTRYSRFCIFYKSCVFCFNHVWYSGSACSNFPRSSCAVKVIDLIVPIAMELHLFATACLLFGRIMLTHQTQNHSM